MARMAALGRPDVADPIRDPIHVGFADSIARDHWLRERNPFPDTVAETRELAAQIRDPNDWIQVSAKGVHIDKRDRLKTHEDPLALDPSLGVEDDGGHAVNLGVELARAQIASQLGKRDAVGSLA